MPDRRRCTIGISQARTGAGRRCVGGDHWRALILLTIWVLVSLRTPHAMVNSRVIRRPDVLLANGAPSGWASRCRRGLSIISLASRRAPRAPASGLQVPVLWAGFVMLLLSAGSFAANRVVRALSRRVSLTTFPRSARACWTAGRRS